MARQAFAQHRGNQEGMAQFHDSNNDYPE